MQDESGGSPEAPGFFGQLRSQHWAVKIILGFVILIVGSPFLGIGAGVAYGIARGPGLVVYIGLILFGYGWFVFTKPASVAGRAASVRSAGAAAAGLPHYCESCGASFGGHLNRCPECDGRWQEHPEAPIQAIARYLNTLVADRRRDLLDEASFRRLRAEYERRLSVLRPAPVTPAPEAAPPPPPPAAVPAERPTAAVPPRRGPFQPTPATPVTPRQPKVVEPGPSAADMGRAVIGWAAERQADILLYVGAFMLSVAAVIFVAYQGEELSGNIRFTVLTAYAVGFLGFGPATPSVGAREGSRARVSRPWRHTRPIDFVALRTQVLSHEQLANDVLWFIASSSCAALYFVLAFRGYGRFYFLPRSRRP